jgi:hypothetical protein
MAFPLGAVLGLGSTIFGAIGSNSSANAARRAEQERIDNQYKYDKSVYQFNWKDTRLDYKYRLKEADNTRSNQEANLAWQDETNLRSYRDTLAIRDFDYNNEVRQFNQSEQNYKLQMGFNNMAAGVAREAEARKFQEVLTGMAFDQQDMFVKMLQEEGQVVASGGSGRSAGKALASAIAGYGRNQAILAESLVSATKENRIANRQIDTEKYGADLAANSRRMLAPLRAPDPSAPLKMPRAVIMDPRKPSKPPKPIKGTNTVQGGSGITTAANVANGIAGGYTSGLFNSMLPKNLQYTS